MIQARPISIRKTHVSDFYCSFGGKKSQSHLRLFKFEVPEEQHIKPENIGDLRMEFTQIDPGDLVRQLNSAATEGGFFSDRNQ